MNGFKAGVEGKYERRVVTSTNTAQWEAGDVGRSSDEFRTVDVLGVGVKYRPFESEMRAWGDYFMLRDRRIMSEYDAMNDAKPWHEGLGNPVMMMQPDERTLWGLAQTAKDQTQLGRAGKGSWHFVAALGAMALIAGTFIPGEGAEVQAVVKAGGKANVLSKLVAAGGAQGAFSRILGFTERNLQKGFTKHGADFGMTGNWNPSRAADFSRAVNQHINAPGVRSITGTYRGNPLTHYVDPSTGLNVIADQAGNYVSGWRLGAEQLESVLTTGRLF